MSTEKRQRLPSTDEVFQDLASAQRGVEHLAGTVLLDRYRLLRLQGSGGAAVVYQAAHTLMHKAVAVKILRPELAVRPDFVQRFLGEARTVARLRHENIVDIVDVGRTENGIVFCVMEYLEGEELAETMAREGPMPWPRARDFVMQVCRALSAAHAVGVVHRDIKPQNCFRIRHAHNPDFIKLLDFGIAKQTDTDHGLTATGVIMGTAEYMSPEQARGSDVDARADIYSVGAMLFELLAGRPPFEGDTFIDVLVKHASEPVPRLSALVQGLDPAVDAIIARTLAKKPGDRFGSTEQLMAAFAVGDGHSFQGRLDGAILTARPESVLRRASSSHQVTGALRRLSRGSLAALALGVVLVLCVILGVTSFERSDQAVDTSADAAAGELIAREPSSNEVERTLGVLGEERPPLPEESPPASDRTNAHRDQPAKEPVRADAPEEQDEARPSEPVPAPSPTIGPLARSQKKASSKAHERRLKAAVMAKCGHNVLTPQSLTIRVRGGGDYEVARAPKYQLLDTCLNRLNLPSGLPPGDYPLNLQPTKSQPSERASHENTTSPFDQ